MAILSDMKELGPESQRFHREIGAYVAEQKIDFLVTVGSDARFIGEGAAEAENGLGRDSVRHFTTKAAFLKELDQYIRPGDVVLVKGSRSMEMEEIVKKIFEDKE